MKKIHYFLKDQDWLKFLKPAERAEIDAATQAFHDSEDGHTCQHMQPRPVTEQCPGTCPGDPGWCCLDVIA